MTTLNQQQILKTNHEWKLFRSPPFPAPGGHFRPTACQDFSTINFSDNHLEPQNRHLYAHVRSYSFPSGTTNQNQRPGASGILSICCFSFLSFFFLELLMLMMVYTNWAQTPRKWAKVWLNYCRFSGGALIMVFKSWKTGRKFDASSSWRSLN